MLKDRDDVKIFVLYLMNSIGYSPEYDVLHDLAVQDGFVTSFDFIEAYGELIEKGNIVKDVDADGKEVMRITDQGRHVAETLSGRLLLSVREKSLKSALRYISFQKSGMKMSSEATELPYGKYEYKCSVKNDSDELFELKVVFDNKKQLEKAMYNFDSKPEFIYKGILALLTGEANYLID